MHSAIKQKNIIPYALLILPSIALGMLAMVTYSVSPVLWGQQAAAFIVFALLACLLRKTVKKVNAATWSILLLLALGATLFGAEAEGVRRWLDLGIFQINAAMLLLPALLIALCSLHFPALIVLGAAVVLCFQPDPSQLTAFSLAVLPVLYLREKKLPWKIAGIIILAILIIRCILVSPAIEPVSYCEGILDMLGNISILLKIAGWLSLAAIPAFFVYQFFRQKRLPDLCLAIYYAVSILFIITGQYPVPFMGFGLSPIAGYFLAYICSADA